jgi:DNA-binding NtrC family response regulator
MIRILVIDDDRHMRTACARVLTKTGWEVMCAETGDEGLSAIRDGVNRIDAVLIDCLMPGGMSGMDFLAQARELAPNLPVILMTGSATQESVAQARKAGAFDCLAKPFIPDQLREVVKNALKFDSSTGE